MQETQLCRLHIAGAIDDNMPVCVILEIAASNGIELDSKAITQRPYIDRVIQNILTLKTTTVTERPFTESKRHGFDLSVLGDIAQFVNGDSHDWKPSGLITAYRHLMKYYDAAVPPQPRGDFIIGQKTPETPLAYNGCMLYRLCKYTGIKTYRQTTLEQMGYAVRELDQDIEIIRERAVAVVKSMSRIQLLNLLITPEMRSAPSPNIRQDSTQIRSTSTREAVSTPKPPPAIIPGTLDAKTLEASHQSLTTLSTVLPRITPNSQAEAVILAALIHAINLTECSNPYQEYLAMRDSVGGTYIPTVDPVFAERYMTNPAWFNIKLTWAPSLLFIYTPENLAMFVTSEGYPLESIQEAGSAIELLQMTRITPTFHLGRHPDMKSTTTTIGLESYDSVDPKLLITYGVSEGGPYNLYTVTELANCFEECKNFINPAKSSEMITDMAIAKLKRFCRDYGIQPRKTQPPSIRSRQPPREITAVQASYSRLQAAIEKVEKRYQANSAQAKRLRRYYLEEGSVVATQIQSCLELLLHMAYYMRGWKIDKNKDLPITAAQATYDLAHQGQVDLNTTTAIRRFEDAVSLLPDRISSFFQNLPLMTVVKSGDTITFQASTSSHKGLTIFERLQIVKDGITTDSCIRMSSNWFAVTAYYYITSCGLDPPFNIADLASIS